MKWGEKPYKSLDWELKSLFGQKIYKLSLDAGCTCPTRDGTKGYGGCTFCSAGGSGDFAAGGSTLEEQMAAAKERVLAKMPRKPGSPEPRFIAYYQSFTNTYGNLDALRARFTENILQPDVVGLSIGTRPDCLPTEAVTMLSELNAIKPVWVELGLQTIHERTSDLINRQYPLDVFEDAYHRLKNAGLRVVVHVILGLPGETKTDMEDTVRYLAGLPLLNTGHFESLSDPGTFNAGPAPLRTPPDGIKLQLMHVLRGTRLADQVAAGDLTVHPWTMEEYVDFVIDMVELLPPEVTVHRLTGDGAKKDLISPLWSGDKKRVLNTLTRRFRERETWQGRCNKEIPNQVRDDIVI